MSGYPLPSAQSNRSFPRENSFSISLALILGHALQYIFSVVVIGGDYKPALRSLKLQKRSLMLRIYTGKICPWGSPKAIRGSLRNIGGKGDRNLRQVINP